MANKQITKQWFDATIQNNFVFGKTLETNPDLCRRLLELILNIKISEINYPEREKTINLRSDSKGIRLDVYVEEKGSNRSFDIEMQVSNSDNLAKRTRYYQELIDGDKLKPGQHYSSLGESIIIFICPFRFKYNRHFYSFHERCDQELDFILESGVTKIFLSTKGTIDDVTPDIKAFLDYVDKGIISGDFVKELDDAVQLVKSNRKAMKEFMTYQMALLESEMTGEQRGLAQGIELGRTEGTESVAIKMLRKGKSFEEIQEFTDLPLQRLEQLANDNRNDT
ncbi:MAG: Rpn family recombination-promoting nuclease/putative transposase [Selenomonadaceae bacterium]|nr:Rpn family recombination-promoting nuclease/putative transposase [Selenomonadaceae bacterium]